MQKRFIQYIFFFLLSSFLIGCTGDGQTGQIAKKENDQTEISSKSTTKPAEEITKQLSAEERAAKLAAEEKALALERAKIEAEIKAEEDANLAKKEEAEKEAKVETKKKIKKTKKKATVPVKKKTPKVAVMTFKETTYHYGTIDEGEKVEHTFYFVNTGNKDLNIIDVKSSCGCTHPTYPFIPIKPGEKGEIGVIFNSNGKWGHQKPTITLTTNAKQKTHKLYLEGRVRPRKKD